VPNFVFQSAGGHFNVCTEILRELVYPKRCICTTARRPVQTLAESLHPIRAALNEAADTLRYYRDVVAVTASCESQSTERRRQVRACTERADAATVVELLAHGLDAGQRAGWLVWRRFLYSRTACTRNRHSHGVGRSEERHSMVGCSARASLFFAPA